MSLQEILTTDMDLQSLAALARQGFDWWLDELAQMLPRGWRHRLSTQPRAWIEPREDGGWRTWRDGRAEPLRRADTRVRLLAPAGTVLVRRVPTPRMSTADTRRMLMLDLDRLSPLTPELVFADIEIAERGEGEKPQQVLLGLLPKAEAARLLARARQDGWRPVALGGSVSGEDVRFDFLPQILQAEGRRPPGRIRRYWWAAAAALFLVNLGVLVGRDVIAVQRLQDLVDAQRPTLEAVQRLRGRVGREEASRRALIAQGRADDPLRIIDIVTRALPASAWVQRLEWNGQRLRIAGFHTGDFDVAAALRATGAVASARNGAPAQAVGGGSGKTFDVTADSRAEAGQ